MRQQNEELLIVLPFKLKLQQILRYQYRHEEVGKRILRPRGVMEGSVGIGYHRNLVKKRGTCVSYEDHGRNGQRVLEQ